MRLLEGEAVGKRQEDSEVALGGAFLARPGGSWRWFTRGQPGAASNAARTATEKTEIAREDGALPWESRKLTWALGELSRLPPPAPCQGPAIDCIEREYR